eukprot:365969-Chlamydomonas_euryale.AAC.15
MAPPGSEAGSRTCDEARWPAGAGYRRLGGAQQRASVSDGYQQAFTVMGTRPAQTPIAAVTKATEKTAKRMRVPLLPRRRARIRSRPIGAHDAQLTLPARIAAATAGAAAAAVAGSSASLASGWEAPGVLDTLRRSGARHAAAAGVAALPGSATADRRARVPRARCASAGLAMLSGRERSTRCWLFR